MAERIPHPAFKEPLVDQNGNITRGWLPWFDKNSTVSSGGSGATGIVTTTVHNDLTGRDAAGAHPSSSVTYAGGTVEDALEGINAVISPIPGQITQLQSRMSANESLDGAQSAQLNSLQNQIDNLPPPTDPNVIYQLQTEVAGLNDDLNGNYGVKAYQNELKRSCGVIIPLYVYPSDAYTNVDYNNVIDLAKKHREVPTIAAVNPGNGPGEEVDYNYAAAIKRLNGADIVVIGYISTEYGARDIELCKQDLTAWKQLYPEVRGIWMDEMANYGNDVVPGNPYTIEYIIEYYSTLYKYAKDTLGLEYVFANPGTTFDIRIWQAGCADNITQYEEAGYPDEATLKQDGGYDGELSEMPVRAKSALVHSVAWDQDNVKLLRKYMGFIYVTDDVMDNPWDTVSPYMEQMYRELDRPFTLDEYIPLPSAPVADRDLLRYDAPSGLWENVPGYENLLKDPTGFNDPTLVSSSYNAGVITLTGGFEAYFRGKKVDALTNGWTSANHGARTVPVFLYYDGTNFIWSESPWTFDMLQIGYVYIKADGTPLFCLRECHGVAQGWAIHKEFHDTTGTYKTIGGALSSYVLSSTTAADRRPLTSAAVLNDEDLPTTNPLAVPGSYTHFYLTGATLAGTPTFTTSNADILALSGNQPYWNRYSGGTWSNALMANNSYTNYWQVAMPTTTDSGSQAYRFFWVMGQTNGSVSEALSESFSSVQFGAFTGVSPEFVAINKVTVQYAAANWSLYRVTPLTASRVDATNSGLQGAQGITGVQGLTGFQGITGVIGLTGKQGITGVIGLTGAMGITGRQGLTGLQGITGTNGVQGLTGTMGITGVVGLTGSVGLTGTVGITGAVGVQGLTGFQGITGTNGLQGLTGFMGITGRQGITGTNGVQGLTGTAGLTGTVGLTGFQGITGANGIAGAQGATGFQGTTGANGIQGLTGFQGITGIRGLTGFQGITGIRGLTGFQGITGTNGVQGLTGIMGITGVVGLTGSVGLTGTVGITGANGVQGVTGVQGLTGTRGITGANGVQGLTGSMGITGRQGLTGANGVQGITGTVGLTGSVGITGANGIDGLQGITGANGIQGITGSNGIQGLTGTRGITGAAGTQGITGFMGITGRQGITGTNGVQGLTGAVGLTGTVGLTGFQGITGASGIAGAQGATGANGIQGLTGSRGITGANGIQGLTGTMGITGFQGITGANGIQGTTGTVGITGAIGAQGITGANGVVGAQGTTGANGIQGITGIRGLTGFQGITGIRGLTGFQGITGIRGLTGFQGITGVRGITGVQGIPGANTNITLSGDVTGSGSTGIATTLASTQNSSITWGGSNKFTGGLISATGAVELVLDSSGLYSLDSTTIYGNPAPLRLHNSGVNFGESTSHDGLSLTYGLAGQGVFLSVCNYGTTTQNYAPITLASGGVRIAPSSPSGWDHMVLTAGVNATDGNTLKNYAPGLSGVAVPLTVDASKLILLGAATFTPYTGSYTSLKVSAQGGGYQGLVVDGYHKLTLMAGDAGNSGTLQYYGLFDQTDNKWLVGANDVSCNLGQSGKKVSLIGTYAESSGFYIGGRKITCAGYPQHTTGYNASYTYMRAGQFTSNGAPWNGGTVRFVWNGRRHQGQVTIRFSTNSAGNFDAVSGTYRYFYQDASMPYFWYYNYGSYIDVWTNRAASDDFGELYELVTPSWVGSTFPEGNTNSLAGYSNLSTSAY